LFRRHGGTKGIIASGFFDLIKHEVEKTFANSLLGYVLTKNGLNESRGPSKIENHPSGCDWFSSAVSAEEKIYGNPGHLW